MSAARRGNWPTPQTLDCEPLPKSLGGSDWQNGFYSLIILYAAVAPDT
jgi:hypothetical protein